MDNSAENTEGKQKALAWVITIVVHGLLFLLFIMVIFRTPIPPYPESGGPGLEVDLGTMIEGTGNTENNDMGDADPNKASTAKTEDSQAAKNDNNVVTNNAEESVNINKTEKTNNTDNKNTTNSEVTKEQTASSELAMALNKLKQKKGQGGDGNSGKEGNSGRPDGKPDGDGKGGGDPNYELRGRVVTKKPNLVDDSQEEGKVVVEIIVDKTGKVVSAVPGARGSTTTSAILYAKAKHAALATKFNEDDKGLDEQKGTITFIFILN